MRGRDLGTTVAEIKDNIASDITVPQGCTMSVGGQFESQQNARPMRLVLGCLSLVAMFFLLYNHFRSVVMVLQVMLNIPFAFIGSVAVLYPAGESFSVASLVGFISLCGISSRHGVLMTATTTALALIPLALAAGQPGKECGRNNFPICDLTIPLPSREG